MGCSASGPHRPPDTLLIRPPHTGFPLASLEILPSALILGCSIHRPPDCAAASPEGDRGHQEPSWLSRWGTEWGLGQEGDTSVYLLETLEFLHRTINDTTALVQSRFTSRRWEMSCLPCLLPPPRFTCFLTDAFPDGGTFHLSLSAQKFPHT